MSEALPFIILIIAAVLAFVLGAMIARRRGYTRSGEVVARCRKGHLFTTVWATHASVRRLDLGWARLQRCPVGNHLTLVAPVDENTLTPEQKREARKHRDTGR
jgi:hypothetical protein